MIVNRTGKLLQQFTLPKSSKQKAGKGRDR